MPAPPDLPPDLFQRAFDRARAWLSTGNVPVKVGVIISFLGVTFLVKYAMDAGLLSFPIEFRLLGVVLGGIAMLTVGWRLRHKEPDYALTVQGGGIAVIYLVAFAAYRLYHLLPATLAFALLVLLTFGTAALAVLQRSQTLAIAGIVGAFLAPILISTEEGNHVALFSYYLVLNLAIAGMAWYMAWRLLIWLGFVFTFAISTAWGWNGYTPEHFATTEPFLIAFFLVYAAIAVTFALRHGPQLKGYVDGTLIFGLPLAVFALQWQLVKSVGLHQAWSALALALFYAALAALMIRRHTTERRLLAESFIALAVGFATITIPLALDAKWTSASWALEGAGLIWVAVRQGRLWSRWSGFALQLLAVGALLKAYSALATDPAMLNGRFLGGLMLVIGATVSAVCLERGPARHAQYERAASLLLIASAALWWYATGVQELDNHLAGEWFVAAAVLFVGISVWLSQRLAARLQSESVAFSTALGLPMLLLLAFRVADAHGHPAQDFGWLAWPAAVALVFREARAYPTSVPGASLALGVGAFWLASALLGWEAHWQMRELARGGVWPWAVVVAVWAGLAHLVGGTRFAARVPELGGVAAGAVGAAALVVAVGLVLGSPGDPAPLAYLPLVNPVDLAAVFAVAVMLLWWRRGVPPLGIDARQVAIAVFGFAFVMVTMDVVRSVHHWNGMPFRAGAAFRNDGLQAALSIVWATLGVAAMFIGARRAKRAAWMAGATLMGVVVGKLFLVDLGNTGTVARVVSFISVGVLLLIIGYFAPLPARVDTEASQ